MFFFLNLQIHCMFVTILKKKEVGLKKTHHTPSLAFIKIITEATAAD